MKSIEKHMCEDKDDGAYVQQVHRSSFFQMKRIRTTRTQHQALPFSP